MPYSYWIGIVAGICFVVGFGALNFGLLKSVSPLYQTLNFFGALGFTYTAVTPGLLILEIIWAAVALYGLWKIWTKRSESEADPATRNAEG